MISVHVVSGPLDKLKGDPRARISHDLATEGLIPVTGSLGETSGETDRILRESEESNSVGDHGDRVVVCACLLSASSDLWGKLSIVLGVAHDSLRT